MNTISLFGFILALGIVVDDAIVMGENIFAEREKGRSMLEAAEVGAIRIARPVVFAVLTTIVAFAPLLFIEGTLGRLLIDLPLVVIVVLILSLVEAIFILPMHLSHDDSATRRPNAAVRAIGVARARVDASLQRFRERAAHQSSPIQHYQPLRDHVRGDGLDLSLPRSHCRRAPALLLPADHPGGNRCRESADAPGHASRAHPLEAIAEIEASVLRAGERLAAELPGDHPAPIRNLYSVVGGAGGGGGGPGQTDTPRGSASNRASLTVELPNPEVSAFTPVTVRDLVA